MTPTIIVDVRKVAAVLLGDGHWHAVEIGSFEVGTYEFQEGSRIVLGGGGASAVSEIGATWRETPNGHRYACPLSSILAVKYQA